MSSVTTPDIILSTDLSEMVQRKLIHRSIDPSRMNILRCHASDDLRRTVRDYDRQEQTMENMVEQKENNNKCNRFSVRCDNGKVSTEVRCTMNIRI